jgi:imidazolonepropionase-like amidohydrolase
MIVLKGRIIDAISDTYFENGVVVIADNKITRVCREEAFSVPPEAEVYKLENGTIMPGMMDVHVHLKVGIPEKVQNPAVYTAGISRTIPGMDQYLGYRILKSYLAALNFVPSGITTVRDMGDMGGYFGLSLRNLREFCGINALPRIKTANVLLTAAGSNQDPLPSWIKLTDVEDWVIRGGADEVIQAARKNMNARADWIKILATGGPMNPEFQQLFTDEEIYAVVNDCMNRGIPVAAHAMYAKGTLTCVKAGVSSIEHGVELTDEITDIMAQKNIYLAPTFTIVKAFINGEGKQPAVYVDRCKERFETMQKSFELAMKKGVKIVAGTDWKAGENAQELQHLVECGMTPMQAIRAGTIEAARLLKMDRQLGSLEEGKLADVLLVSGNPLEDITILTKPDNIKVVIIDGKVEKKGVMNNEKVCL